MENALEIRGLSVKYGNHYALKDINLKVSAGEYLGIMGPNGGGKSTLLKAVLGLVSVDKGEIKIFGESGKTNRKTIGYVPQFSYMDRKFPISVTDVVLCSFLKNGLHPFRRFSEKEKKSALEKLEMVGLSNLAGRQISELSGGEFQRMLIARALATNPKILLLDEPTASVDPASREKIYNLLAEINKDITIVMVTHDVSAVATEVKMLACLNETLVYHGGPKLTENVVQKLYGCPVDLIAHGIPHRVLGHHHGGEDCC